MKKLLIALPLVLVGCAGASEAVFGTMDKVLLAKDRVETQAIEAATETIVRYCRRTEADRLELRDRFDYGAGPIIQINCQALPPQT